MLNRPFRRLCLGGAESEFPSFPAALLLSIFVLLSACDSGAASEPSPLEPSPFTLKTTEGDQQTGTVGEQTARPLAVKAVDGEGRPATGVEVLFQVRTGDAAIQNPRVSTNDEGMAQTHVTFGLEAGPVVVEAEADGQVGPPVVFDLEAKPRVFTLTWKPLALPENEPMAVSVSPSGTFFAINAFPYYRSTEADRSLIYVSHDQGESWAPHDVDAAQIEYEYTEAVREMEVYHVEPLSDDEWLMMGVPNRPGPEVLFYTDDGGSTWLQVSDYYVDDRMHFTSDPRGHVIATGRGYTGVPHFYRSSDGGQTWSPHELPPNNQVMTPYFGLDPSTYFVGADNLLRSSNSGEDWSKSADGWVSSMAADASGTLLAVGRNVLVSTDNGETWSQREFPREDAYGHTVTALARGVFLVGFRAGFTDFSFFLTEDLGETWINVDASIEGINGSLSEVLQERRVSDLKIIEGPDGRLYLTVASRSESSQPILLVTEGIQDNVSQ